jgi:hypothetical protein
MVTDGPDACFGALNHVILGSGACLAGCRRESPSQTSHFDW